MDDVPSLSLPPSIEEVGYHISKLYFLGYPRRFGLKRTNLCYQSEQMKIFSLDLIPISSSTVNRGIYIYIYLYIYQAWRGGYLRDKY